MSSQNYRNHRRYLPIWHLLVPILLLLALVGSVLGIMHADHHSHYLAVAFCIGCIVLCFMYWYIRAFALRAQDRAIRAEENFRHYLLTGKPFDSHLRMGQIIALRFASDEEMPVLARRALAEHMPANEIKKAIKHWRADYNRV